MWPALVQLLELAPHVTRLVPVADRYLQSRGDSGKAQRRAMEETAERLRGDMELLGDGLRRDMTQLAAAQAGIYHQLNQQHETLARIAADMRSMRATADELETRLTRMEARMQRLSMTLVAGLIVFAIFAAVVIAVFAVLHFR